MDVSARLNAILSDRCTLERELGQGGMATVYLASDLRHHRRVALKVLRPELAAVLGPERFLSEIQTTANLQHPHLLPLFDSGEADGLLFYVMPYVEGEPVAVFTAEHLAAIALQTGRAKDKARVVQFVEAGALDADRLESILSRHHLSEAWSRFERQFMDDHDP